MITTYTPPDQTRYTTSQTSAVGPPIYHADIITVGPTSEPRGHSTGIPNKTSHQVMLICVSSQSHARVMPRAPFGRPEGRGNASCKLRAAITPPFSSFPGHATLPPAWKNAGYRRGAAEEWTWTVRIFLIGWGGAYLFETMLVMRSAWWESLSRTLRVWTGGGRTPAIIAVCVSHLHESTCCRPLVRKDVWTRAESRLVCISQLPPYDDGTVRVVRHEGFQGKPDMFCR